MLQLYTANFLNGFNLFKMVVMFLFSQLDGPNAFFPQIQQTWPWLQKGRKMPDIYITLLIWIYGVAEKWVW